MSSGSRAVKIEHKHFLGDGCASHAKVDEVQPVTTTEIAEILGVSRTTINRWNERRATTGFPKQIGTRKAKTRGGTHGTVYDMREVEWWYRYWCTTRRKAN